MKINNSTSPDKLNPTPKDSSVQKAVHGKTGETTGAGDKSQLSALAHQIARAKAVADALPDVRADRVTEVRERLASGFYDTPEAKEALVSRLADLVKETLF